jgi:hypothetical protein
VREVPIPDTTLPVQAASFIACVATILELRFEDAPRPAPDEDPATGWILPRWLGMFGLGLARVADPAQFSWAGPWIARIGGSATRSARYVVMYGVPSGVVWDPAGDGALDSGEGIEAGFVVAATDIAQARPPRAPAPAGTGSVEAIYIAGMAAEPMQSLQRVRAIHGKGLDGDRHVIGTGTFPSGPPGSALTLIAVEVCESFDPPLGPDEHRRNLVVRGIDVNALVGHDFRVGNVRCRGMRLCEPCTVVQRYAGRPVLRPLVHRGGLRADILEDGEISVGDPVSAARRPTSA